MEIEKEILGFIGGLVSSWGLFTFILFMKKNETHHNEFIETFTAEEATAISATLFVITIAGVVFAYVSLLPYIGAVTIFYAFKAAFTNFKKNGIGTSSLPAILLIIVTSAFLVHLYS